jgi:hypothetical protein
MSIADRAARCAAVIVFAATLVAWGQAKPTSAKPSSASCKISTSPGIHFLVPTVNDQKTLTQQSMVRVRMKNIVYIARELAGSQHGPRW